MSQEIDKRQKDGEGYLAVNILSIAFLVLGMVCLIAGCSIASQHYDFDWLKFCGAIVITMFCFGWAALMRVCAIYLREHDLN